MSAPEITSTTLHSLQTNRADFYLINYANADMVGHSGDLTATIKAVECLDAQLGLLHNELVEKQNGVMIITADHGNAEQMVDPITSEPHPGHTKNNVPFVVVANKKVPPIAKVTQLADVAEYVTQLMGI